MATSVPMHGARGLGRTRPSYLALNRLIMERLTLADIFTEQEIHELGDAALRRSLGS
ncbi:hypothetical protein ACFOWE_23070 [Planomonospora corallina]|uniref:Uncharacterized protein n=1 Tax=Planomonospora corallina TaxID=1806052 RepID=A0ABV8IAZ8_9ACTN